MSGGARTIEARTRARRRALEILHAADVRGGDPRDGLGPDDDHRTRSLVEGVWAHRDALDALIGSAARHWSVDRMPVTDRNLLRLGAFEILHTDAAPRGVIIDGVELAKLLSTPGSPRFVNGILARLLRDMRP